MDLEEKRALFLVFCDIILVSPCMSLQLGL